MSSKNKFRAWNIEKKIMCYDREDGYACHWDGTFASEVGLINMYLNLDDSIKEYEYMQFIGNTDVDGREIYEGDIVRIGLEKYEVWWNYDSYSFTLSNENESRSPHLFPGETIEVIGNIYENQDLLEEVIGNCKKNT